MTTDNATMPTRRPAAEVLFPGEASAAITAIRTAWANLMDCGRVVEADSILDAIDEATASLTGDPVVFANVQIATINSYRRIVTAAREEEFEAMLQLRALEQYPRSPRAREVFVDAGRLAGLYNDAFIKARQAAEAWLNPPPPRPRLGQTQRNQRGVRLHGADQLRSRIVRTGTGSNGS